VERQGPGTAPSRQEFATVPRGHAPSAHNGSRAEPRRDRGSGDQREQPTCRQPRARSLDAREEGPEGQPARSGAGLYHECCRNPDVSLWHNMLHTRKTTVSRNWGFVE